MKSVALVIFIPFQWRPQQLMKMLKTLCSIQVAAWLEQAARGIGTVVEHLPHHPKVEGSSPGAAAAKMREIVWPGNANGESITVPLTSCLTSLE